VCHVCRIPALVTAVSLIVSGQHPSCCCIAAAADKPDLQQTDGDTRRLVYSAPRIYIHTYKVFCAQPAHKPGRLGITEFSGEDINKKRRYAGTCSCNVLSTASLCLLFMSSLKTVRSLRISLNTDPTCLQLLSSEVTTTWYYTNSIGSSSSSSSMDVPSHGKSEKPFVYLFLLP